MHILVCLHVVDHAANVGVELFLDGKNGLVREVEPLARTHLVHELKDVVNRQLVEAETNKFSLQCFIYSANVVAYKTKPHIVLRIVVAIKKIAQCGLCIFRHVIHLIQDDKLDAGAKERLCGDKAIDLIANDVNAAFIGGVQMNHEATICVLHGGSLVLIDKIHDGGGFSGSWGAVKQQVGEMSGGDDVAQHEFV